MQIASMNDPFPIHIDGRAGQGKTYLLYPVVGALCKRDKFVLLPASSAFAAKNYPGGDRPGIWGIQAFIQICSSCNML
jgi:hypothetical protein